MSQTVIGFFDNFSEAENAIEKLVNKGISRDRIDVSGGTSTGTTTGTDYNDTGIRSVDTDSSLHATHKHHDDDDNAITRFFKNLFGDDDHDAEKYSRVASRSQRIVTVHAMSKEEAEDAADILDDCGAVDVDERAAQYGYNTATGSYNTDYTDRDRSADSTDKLNVIEENLEVGKREVETGGVRLRSRIVERPVEESIRLREERVNVERTPVDRDATDADFSNFEEKDIEMIERAEVPVVNKQARVVEEVRLNKEVDERDETISDTVRNTEVDVEKMNRSDTDDTRNRF
jgi:uncharacterized protein (TIGR02271 family)